LRSKWTEPCNEAAAHTSAMVLERLADEIYCLNVEPSPAHDRLPRGNDKFIAPPPETDSRLGSQVSTFRSLRKTNISHSGQTKEVRFAIYGSFRPDIFSFASRDTGNSNVSHTAFAGHQHVSNTKHLPDNVTENNGACWRRMTIEIQRRIVSILQLAITIY
jgi:hypothetical protein